jgi:hypothetical protein
LQLRGYWTRASGTAILDANGNPIARASLEQVMSQTAAAGQVWQLEQMFSPISRAAELTHREAAPYLAEIIDGRAVVRDYGIQNADGSWRLASGTAITDSNGAVISAPTIADIKRMAAPASLAASAAAAGHLLEWRTETLGFNPFAALTVDRMGVYLIDGRVVDYSVRVSDEDGAFDVWARNLDRALALQHKLGAAGEFNLRAYAINFDTLDEAGSTEDSAYRVEILTAGQFHFATSAYGVDFRSQRRQLNARRTGQKTASVLRRGRAGRGKSINAGRRAIPVARGGYSRTHEARACA